jgi:hypothetical protein
VPDRSNGHIFYALDFKTGIFYNSQNGGEKFNAIKSQGLPKNLTRDQPHSREQAWPLHATPNYPGDLWLVSQQGLFHSRDGGQNFQLAFNPQTTGLQIQQLSFGRAAPKNKNSIHNENKNNNDTTHYPTLYAIAEKNKERGIYRSLDQGASWQQINDARHQYGQRYRTLAADPKIFGRVYVGTDGRGIVVGDIVGKN